MNWRIGLFALRGRDLEYARSCFFRMLDVDLFNSQHIARAKHLYGLALIHEADSAGRVDKLETALNLATAALNYVHEERQAGRVADVSFCLGRLKAQRRDLTRANTRFRSAAERFETWHGNHTRAAEVRARIDREP